MKSMFPISVIRGLAFFLFGFCSAALYAQQKPATAFNLFFEKAYLHTDRDLYAQGDTLWYKAYLVSGLNVPAKTSSTLYVDLIAPDAHVVNSQVIRLNGGFGKGDFELLDDLPAGMYRLRAYTNWMRNFGDNFVFEKQVGILKLNPDVAKADESTSTPIKNKKKPAGKALNQSMHTLPVQSPVVGFYPEGGAMLQGITSLIGVKAEDGAGKGITAKGLIINNAGDTLARFSCDTLGMGLFTLLPVKGQTYQALVRMERNGSPMRDVTVLLPQALAKGLSLQVKQNDSVLHAVISSSDYAGLKAGTGPNYTVRVKHAGKTLLQQQVQAVAEQLMVNIPTANLPEGIATITLYDEQNRPNCERLVYIHHRGQNELKIATNKKAFQPFEKTIVQINTAQATNLSVAVVDAGVEPEQDDNIMAYLMLNSDLKGHVEHASRYFDTTNVNRFKQLDMLLLTQGWRDFIWRKLADTAISISHNTENGITLAGYVKDEVNHKPVPQVNVSLFASDLKGQKLFSARADQQGYFAFSGLDFEGMQNVKLSSVNDKGQKKGSFYVDSVFKWPAKPVAAADNTIDTNAVAAHKMLEKALVFKMGNNVTQLREVKVKGNKNTIVLDNGEHYTTWGPPQEFDVTPADYWTKTLSWFLVQKDKRAISSQNVEIPGVCYIVDGKPSYPILIVNGSSFHIDRNLYFNMPIEKFTHIEVAEISVRARSFFMIRLTTKDNPLIDNPGSLSASIKGYYEARTFYKPNYEAGKPSKSDLRNTILWEPEIKTDAAGNATFSYYNAGNKTKVRVVAQGITAQGRPIATTLVYEVK